ncbi:MAG: hypothetical protein AAF974_13460 [Cyanobacteria bacterium P01_E01_bin.34]
MQNQYQPLTLRSHYNRPLDQGATVVNHMRHRKKQFCFPQIITRTTTVAFVMGLLFAGAPPAVSEPTLTFDPPPGTRLSNFDAYLTVTFELNGSSWEALPWDWQNPRVRLNGTDISLPVRSLLSGATASVLTPEEIVVSQQTMTGDSMVLALSGLRLDDGFNRLIVELTPNQDGIEPLKFDVSYPVIAGQDQATQ